MHPPWGSVHGNVPPVRTPVCGSKNFLGGRMVKKFLMGCLKNYFRVLKFFGCRTGDRPDPVHPTPVTVRWTFPQVGLWYHYLRL